jgi:hypothetical protein
MTFSKFTKCKISSRDYVYAKYLKSITISEETRAKMKAHKFTEEHKKRLSESHKGPHPKNRHHADFKGEKNPFYNKIHSEETKEKIRQKKLGTTQTEETKLKKSISMQGKNTYIRTEEHRKKLSDALKGRKLTEEHKKHISEFYNKNK